MSSNAIDRTIRVLGILAGVIGLFAIGSSFHSYYNIFSNGESLLDHIFILFFALIVLAFGVFCVVVAVRTWKRITVSAIRQISAIIAIVLWAAIMALLELIGVDPLSTPIWYSLLLFGAVLAAVLFYVISTQWLIAKSSMAQQPPQPVSRHLIGLVCFFLWVTSSSLIRDLASNVAGYEYLSRSPWVFIGLVLPIVLAWGAYKSIMYFANRRHKHRVIKTAT